MLGRIIHGRRWLSAAASSPIQLFGVGGRYAHALYNAAAEAKTVDKVAAELAALQKLADSNDTFEDFLKDPTINKDEKKAKLDQMFGKNICETTTRFLGVLAENGRLPDLHTIALDFQKIVDAHSGKVVAEVVTAAPMAADESKALEKALSKHLKPGEKLEIQTSVKPEILGGLVVNIGDKSMDLSVASHIEEYRKMVKDFAA